MIDMIPAGTGNSRLLRTIQNALTLYPTYESFMQALIAGTFPIDLAGLNTAGIATLGSALSKENILPDDLVTTLGITQSDPQIKDALETIANEFLDTRKYWWQKCKAVYTIRKAGAGYQSSRISNNYTYYDNLYIDPDTGVITTSAAQTRSVPTSTGSYYDTEGKYYLHTDGNYYMINYDQYLSGVLIYLQPLSYTKDIAGEVLETLWSFTKNAYPNYGVIGDYVYKSIGNKASYEVIGEVSISNSDVGTSSVEFEMVSNVEEYAAMVVYSSRSGTLHVNNCGSGYVVSTPSGSSSYSYFELGAGITLITFPRDEIRFTSMSSFRNGSLANSYLTNGALTRIKLSVGVKAGDKYILLGVRK